MALCMPILVTIYCCLFVGLSRLAQALPHASQLTYLDVSACSISDEGISDLADAISDKAMLNEEFHGAAPTPAHLQVLKLRDNKISDHGVKDLGEAMQQSSSSQDLDLAGNQVNDC
jgi:Ran GTPase-activating protein (RanGAP) involved in mRNA processing and transport